MSIGAYRPCSSKYDTKLLHTAKIRNSSDTSDKFLHQCTMVKLKNGVKSSQLWKVISPPIFNENLSNFERWCINFLRKHPQQAVCYLKILFSWYLKNKLLSFIFWMFIYHLSKFDKFSLTIGGEIIFQSWPLLTPFVNFCIVQWLVDVGNLWQLSLLL